MYGDDDSGELKGDVFYYALISIVNNILKLHVDAIEASNFEKIYTCNFVCYFNYVINTNPKEKYCTLMEFISPMLLP